MFTFTETEDLRDLLLRLEQLRNRLEAGATLPRRWADRIRRDLQAEAVAGSIAIDGVRVTADEVRRILVGDRPPHVTEEEAIQVIGYRDAMSYVSHRAADAGFAWSADLVCAVHERVLAGSHALGAGQYRSRSDDLPKSGDSTLRSEESVSYTPPEASEVPRLIDSAMEWIAQPNLAAPLTAALVHAAITAIQPFAHGNGRTARICALLALQRGGYRRPELTSLDEWWGRYPQGYHALFGFLGSKWTLGVDVTPFVHSHLAAHIAQIEEWMIRLEAERDIWTALENICLDVADVRAVDALYDAFRGTTVTNRYYREIAQVSPVTAATDLARLTAAGLLRTLGAGVSTRYTATPVLMSRVAAELGSCGTLAEDTPLEDQRAWIVVQLRWRVYER